jgi:hypothetical protein
VDVLEVNVKNWNSQFSNLMVVLNESLKIHMTRPDETLQTKENKIS